MALLKPFFIFFSQIFKYFFIFILIQIKCLLILFHNQSQKNETHEKSNQISRINFG
jgi:hypothetical protein